LGRITRVRRTSVKLASEEVEPTSYEEACLRQHPDIEAAMDKLARDLKTRTEKVGRSYCRAAYARKQGKLAPCRLSVRRKRVGRTRFGRYLACTSSDT
jgi:hypothetical protein